MASVLLFDLTLSTFLQISQNSPQNQIFTAERSVYRVLAYMETFFTYLCFRKYPTKYLILWSNSILFVWKRITKGRFPKEWTNIFLIRDSGIGRLCICLYLNLQYFRELTRSRPTCQVTLCNDSGWPRHRENREFGSYFFQTGKTQGILLWHREKFWDTGKIFFCDTGKKLDTGKIFDCDY